MGGRRREIDTEFAAGVINLGDWDYGTLQRHILQSPNLYVQWRANCQPRLTIFNVGLRIQTHMSDC